MALISYYATGTATVAANGTAVTGQGTQWAGSVKPGDQFRAGGLTERILSVDSNTSLTLARGWPGSARTAASYEVYVVPAPSEIVGTTRTLLASLSSGVLSAFAGLTSAANKLPFFTGAGTMDVTDLTAKGREIIGAADNAAARGAIGAQVAGNYEPARTFAQNQFFGRVASGEGEGLALTAAQVKNALSLNNVNNTSDADKPVSTAQQAALNGKVNAVDGSASSLTVTGNFARQGVDGLNNYTLDSAGSNVTITNGGYFIASNFSGMILVNNRNTGGIALYLCGGGAGLLVGQYGNHTSNVIDAPAQNGYAVGNSGASATFGIQLFRTRASR